MDEVYRLVFRGEVLEGQHPAVVRRRLAQAASFDDAVLDRLFSGRPVVLKRAADKATAARFQALFKKAGARLRVMPLEREGSAGAEPTGAAGVEAAVPSSDFELLPAGADVLRQDERMPWRPRQIDTSGLALEKASFRVAEPPSEPSGPDVSHLTLGVVGENLGPTRAAPDTPVSAPELEVAAPGAVLGTRRAAPIPPLDVDNLQFDVAEPGSDLDQRERPPPPSVPDVSHLTVDDPG